MQLVGRSHPKVSFPRLNLSSHFVFHRAVCVPELGSAKRGGMAKKLKEATEGDRDFIAARKGRPTGWAFQIISDRVQLQHM